MSPTSRHIIRPNNGCSRPATQELSNRVALLLAGGDGMRLRELTSEIAGTPIPKQYCRLLQGSSLLEATISRARLFAPLERISVVVNSDHLDLAKNQVKALPESNIFVQPLNRDTGPGMIFALLHLERISPDATVAVFPTDHYVDKDWAFIAHVLRAANAIARYPDKIALLGVVPDGPETEYGYILPADPLRIHGKAYQVEAFTEKPSVAAAQAVIARGGLWNMFVMVFKLPRMLELIRELVPHEFGKLASLRTAQEGAAGIYQNLNPWNFSTQVLARIPQHLIVLRVANVRWSDWGTRESVERTFRTLKLAPFWNLSSPIAAGRTASGCLSGSDPKSPAAKLSEYGTPIRPS
jgi:mannose-1-phosphate guanylyltransferase